jgi:hypothetical protein
MGLTDISDKTYFMKKLYPILLSQVSAIDGIKPAITE